MCKLGISVRGWSLFCFGNVRNVKNMKNVLKYLYVDLLLFQNITVRNFQIFKSSNRLIFKSIPFPHFHIS